MTMTKAILAPFFAIAMLAGVALAADEPAGQATDPAQKEQELAAALKKCDAMSGADKQKCVEAAKKKFGQM